MDSIFVSFRPESAERAGFRAGEEDDSYMGLDADLQVVSLGKRLSPMPVTLGLRLLRARTHHNMLTARGGPCSLSSQNITGFCMERFNAKVGCPFQI